MTRRASSPRTDPTSRPVRARRLRPAVLAVAAGFLIGGLAGLPARGVAQDDGFGSSEDFRIGLPAYVQGDDLSRPRVMYRDSTISLNNVCAVRKARLDPSRDPVYVNGQPIGFCCTPCPAVFSMNPERYLLDLKLTFRDPVRPSKKAVIDSSRRLKLGQDIYFFSSLATMRRFQADPLAYCGRLTDPVTHVRFQPAPDSPHVRYRDRDYWFDSAATKAAFQETPAQYADRQPGT